VKFQSEIANLPAKTQKKKDTTNPPQKSTRNPTWPNFCLSAYSYRPFSSIASASLEWQPQTRCRQPFGWYITVQDSIHCSLRFADSEIRIVSSTVRPIPICLDKPATFPAQAHRVLDVGYQCWTALHKSIHERIEPAAAPVFELVFTLIFSRYGRAFRVPRASCTPNRSAFNCPWPHTRSSASTDSSKPVCSPPSRNYFDVLHRSPASWRTARACISFRQRLRSLDESRRKSASQARQSIRTIRAFPAR